MSWLVATNKGDAGLGERPGEIFALARLNVYQAGHPAVIHGHTRHGLHFFLVLILGFGIADQCFMIDGGLVDKPQNDGLACGNRNDRRNVLHGPHSDSYHHGLFRFGGRGGTRTEPAKTSNSQEQRGQYGSSTPQSGQEDRAYGADGAGK
jgi:hypothetical protein